MLQLLPQVSSVNSEGRFQIEVEHSQSGIFIHTYFRSLWEFPEGLEMRDAETRIRAVPREPR
jgi:hypothetical protein